MNFRSANKKQLPKSAYKQERTDKNVNKKVKSKEENKEKPPKKKQNGYKIITLKFPTIFDVSFRKCITSFV